MRDPRPPLLLTRPEPQARRFAAEMRARFGADWPVVIAPILRIEPVPAELPAADWRVFTSENAVAAHGAGCGPAYCVGERTAVAARAAGFEVAVTEPDAARLIPRLIALRPAGRGLVLRGRHAAAEIAERLNSAGIETGSAILYDQIACPLTAEAQALLAGNAPVLLPLFSPRSARLVAEAAQGAGAPLWIAPISAAARLAFAAPAARAEVAETPDAPGVLAALGRLIGSASA